MIFCRSGRWFERSFAPAFSSAALTDATSRWMGGFASSESYLRATSCVASGLEGDGSLMGVSILVVYGAPPGAGCGAGNSGRAVVIEGRTQGHAKSFRKR